MRRAYYKLSFFIIYTMTVILDAGHGVETPGKRSPDETLREYKYCREIAQKVKDILTSKGIKVVFIMENIDEDVALSKRCKTVNQICKTDNCILVSIHCDAYGSDGKWHTASGWSARVSLNASSKSKELAGYLFDSAKSHNLKTRQYRPTEKYWQQNLAICRDTNCPAVLTENLFQDNEEDVKFLLAHKDEIADLHVQGILEYIKNH